ncbi:MAG: hypothetical protein EOO41_01600 [Methanobacteriota archaeon]|nr:MAG: hypothetical protein EOO41_01600 [Euryarchaeota archaeon]
MPLYQQRTTLRAGAGGKLRDAGNAPVSLLQRFYGGEEAQRIALRSRFLFNAAAHGGDANQAGAGGGTLTAAVARSSPSRRFAGTTTSAPSSYATGSAPAAHAAVLARIRKPAGALQDDIE